MAPEFIAEQFNPPTQEGGVVETSVRSGESRESFQESTQKAKQVRAALHTVITSREELEKYLAQYGLHLLTSAVEFDQSKDFIASSYILYTQHGNYLEPLQVFLERYPDYIPSVQSIAQSISQKI